MSNTAQTACPKGLFWYLVVSGPNADGICTAVCPGFDVAEALFPPVYERMAAAVGRVKSSIENWLRAQTADIAIAHVLSGNEERATSLLEQCAGPIKFKIRFVVHLYTDAGAVKSVVIANLTDNRVGVQFAMRGAQLPAADQAEL